MSKRRIPRKLKKWLKKNNIFCKIKSKFILIKWLGIKGKKGVYHQFYYDKKNKNWHINFEQNGGYNIN